MQDDPIIEEIRKVRDQLASEVDYDVRALGRKLQRSQMVAKRKLVSLPPKLAEDDSVAQGKQKRKNG
jgi:hypothetical protein